MSVLRAQCQYSVFSAVFKLSNQARLPVPNQIKSSNNLLNLLKRNGSPWRIQRSNRRRWIVSNPKGNPLCFMVKAIAKIQLLLSYNGEGLLPVAGKKEPKYLLNFTSLLNYLEELIFNKGTMNFFCASNWTGWLCLLLHYCLIIWKNLSLTKVLWISFTHPIELAGFWWCLALMVNDFYCYFYYVS